MQESLLADDSMVLLLLMTVNYGLLFELEVNCDMSSNWTYCSFQIMRTSDSLSTDHLQLHSVHDNVI